LQPGLVPASNLASHITPDSWADALKVACETSGGKTTELEPAKTLQEGCSTTLVAALDPSIEGEFVIPRTTFGPECVLINLGSSGGFLQDSKLRAI
jgi:hypothetical protein